MQRTATNSQVQLLLAVMLPGRVVAKIHIPVAR